MWLFVVEDRMNKLLIICGPTATGKTALGIKIAKEFNGEIISADSRQTYKGMDIITGKDIEKSKVKSQKLKVKYEIKGVPIWGLDLVEPDEKFSVAHWVKFAKLVIKDIWRRKKLPIIVGGTGFWIKALTYGIESLGIEPDWELRKKLSKLSIEELQDYLRKTCLERMREMNDSDKNNPRRLIRAIEISIAASNKSQATRKKTCNLKPVTCSFLIIGLKTKNYKSLYKRIDQRVEERVKQGAQREIEKLLKKHSWENSALGTTIGYRQWRDFFESKKNLDEIVKRWKFSEHAYARRQMTWFKKEKKIKWFDIDKKNWQEKVVKEVKEWYSKNDA